MRVISIMAEQTVIQFRNKTVTNIHSHDHVHIHGPTDQASLMIVAIVMAGVVGCVLIVVCLVSTLKGRFDRRT